MEFVQTLQSWPEWGSLFFVSYDWHVLLSGAVGANAVRCPQSYDWNRLVSDPAYNTQMGAAEVAALLQEYRRSYILTFAGYNAGRKRVRQWVWLGHAICPPGFGW
jgi:Transglycosylase SLT domain